MGWSTLTSPEMGSGGAALPVYIGGMKLLASLARLSRRELLLLNERLQEKLRALDESETGVMRASVVRSIQRHSGKVRVSLSRVPRKDIALAIEAVDVVLLRYDLILNRKQYIAFLDLLCEEAIRRIRNRGEFEDPLVVVRQLRYAGSMIDDAFPGYGEPLVRTIIKMKIRKGGTWELGEPEYRKRRRDVEVASPLDANLPHGWEEYNPLGNFD